MIQLIRCSEVPQKFVYETFTAGFADYAIQMSLTEDEFFGYFFGREGNQLAHSFIAVDQASQQGIGVVLAGIRQFRGKRTMRCGGFCVLPEFRGTQAATLLLEKHRQEALACHCQQLYLEVIHDNHRAKRFYQKNGYSFGNHLHYYQKSLSTTEDQPLTPDVSIPDKPADKQSYTITALTLDQLRAFRQSQSQLELTWQNEIESIEKLEGIYWGLFIETQLAGVLSQFKSSIQLLALIDPYRGQGYGRILIEHGIKYAREQEKPIIALRCSFPANPEFQGFLQHLGFTADSLFQNEMYLELPDSNTGGSR